MHTEGDHGPLPVAGSGGPGRGTRALSQGSATVEGTVTEYCICTTTFESADQARPIVQRIVEEQLAACAQAMDIASTYLWKGDLEQVTEVLVLFKTRVARYAALEARLRELHPYETPEILQVPVTGGLGAYLAWVDEQTRG